VRTHASKVYLVGAGPGAADLITLRAARVLADADVVLVDDLVNRDVLLHCRRGVRIIAVGKRAGCRSTPQDFIQRLTLRYARQGYRVVRLKGGDPLVFARGGEELAFLASHGISVEVVSGLSAGLAVPATLGIPVTHRDCAHGVTFLTGHPRAGQTLDWDALVRAGTTLVIYMGLGQIESIGAQLIAHGMPEATPAAAIEQGTLSGQRQVIAALVDLPRVTREAGLRAPALIVIGDVVAWARAVQTDSAAECAAANA